MDQEVAYNADRRLRFVSRELSLIFLRGSRAAVQVAAVCSELMLSHARTFHAVEQLTTSAISRRDWSRDPLVIRINHFEFGLNKLLGERIEGKGEDKCQCANESPGEMNISTVNR